MLRAIANLEMDNLANREALYGRARIALVAHLREISPVLTEMELVRERIDLESAIAKVKERNTSSYVNDAPPGAPAEGITPIAPMPKLFPRR